MSSSPPMPMGHGLVKCVTGYPKYDKKGMILFFALAHLRCFFRSVYSLNFTSLEIEPSLFPRLSQTHCPLTAS